MTFLRKLDKSVGSHLVVKNPKITSKIRMSVSTYSHRWRKRTKTDHRLRVPMNKCVSRAQ